MRAATETALPVVRMALYVRLSKEDVSGKRLGIESCAVQERDGRAAIAHEHGTVDDRHVFVDDGISGTKEKGRDDWQRMLACAKRREFDCIAVRDLDRFSRLDPVRTLVIIRELTDMGVKLWSYRERQFISVDGDNFVFTAMRARQARAEAEKASERITAGLRARAREGRATGRASFGYRVKIIADQDVRDARAGGDDTVKAGKWWVKHEPELDVVRHIIAVFVETRSYTTTLQRLNADGTRPPEGKNWGNTSSLRKILMQPLYRGHRLHKGERIEHPDLAIFTAAEVRRLDAALAHASKNRPWASAPRKPGKTFNLAVGFIACGVCGGAIVSTGCEKTSNRSYLCGRHRLHACRGIGSRSAARVDEALIRAVDATLTPEAIAAVCALVRKEVETKPHARQDDRKRITREIVATEKRVANLTESVAEAPPAARPALYTKLAAESDRLAALRAGLARVEGAPAELDAQRVVTGIQKRARHLRELLAKGGRDAAEAIRAVLGNARLKAHLVVEDGKRGWRLGGRIAGFYVFDDHYSSDTNLRLDVYKAAKELARCVHEAGIRDAELRDQATRASKSTFLGLCEGLPSDSAGTRRRHFEIANNSLHEVVGAVDLAATLGVVDEAVAQSILTLAVRIKRMLRALPR